MLSEDDDVLKGEVRERHKAPTHPKKGCADESEQILKFVELAAFVRRGLKSPFRELTSVRLSVLVGYHIELSLGWS